MYSTKERRDYLNRDTRLPLHLEITVPRIALPTPHPISQQVYPIISDNRSEDTVQVQLIEETTTTVVDHNVTLPMQEQAQASQAELHRAFFLFSGKYEIDLGHGFLMRVLHNRTALPDQQRIVDEIPVVVVTNHNDRSLTDQVIELLPGIHYIAILFDKDNVPGDYTIDGANA